MYVNQTMQVFRRDGFVFGMICYYFRGENVSSETVQRAYACTQSL